MKLLKFLAVALLMAISLNAFAVTEVTDDASFKKEVLDSKKPVIMMLYADWCGFCKQLDPELVKNEAQFGGKIKFARVNVDKTGVQARALPTVLLIKNGKIVSGFEGFDLLKLQLMIDDALK